LTTLDSGKLKLRTEDEKGEFENMKTEIKKFLEGTLLTFRFKHL
jgi:hypothetical protein